jgi:hypothetical protein
MKKMKDLKSGAYFVLPESLPTAVEDEFLLAFRAVDVIDDQGKIVRGRLDSDGIVKTCDHDALESNVIELVGLG